MTRSMQVSQISSSKIETFEQILESIGGFGPFQILMLAIVLGLEIPTACIGFIPVFTGKIPEYWECDGLKISNAEACGCNGTLSAFPLHTTVVGEWRLICDFAWISDFINTTQMLGMTVGIIYASQLADWYGRKYSTLGSALFMGLGSVISAIAPNVYVYAAGRVMCGAGFSALLNITGLYAMEFLPVSKRALCSCAGTYGWGTMLLGLVAYFVRPWRDLAWISTSSLLIFCPLLILFVPESPRFLMRQGKLDETLTVLNYIAKLNGRPKLTESDVQEVSENERGDVSVKRASYVDLLRRKDLRSRTLCFCAIWFSWALVYFGLYFNIKNVAGNLYLSVLYMGLADVIGFPAAFLIMDRFGRRRSMVLTMSLGAMCLVVLAGLQFHPDLHTMPGIIMLACTIGKFFMAMTRCSAKCFTAESYPTDIRGIGTGLCGGAVAVGAAVAPQLVFIGTLEPSVPFFVFALISIGGSFFSFFVAETSGKPLQESIAQKLVKRLSIISSQFLAN